MAYTVTEEITYSGTGYDVTVLTPLEMFVLYKSEHSVPEEATTNFNNATGLTSVDVTKPSDSVVRHVAIWEDKASYDTWRAANTPVTPGADWAYAEISKEES
tara:strand:- start:528 stop:833 length:306 start_codon:yes stop_codon:yes gene_type:complete